jgi:hypothetical protein
MPRYRTHFAALFVLLLASNAMASPDVGLAVLGLEPVDVPEPLAQQLTDALRQRASSTGGVRMVQGKDLIEVKMVFGCAEELPTCMAQAGKTLGADKLLYGIVKKGSSKNTVTVALKLLDVKTAVVEKFVNDTVQKRELAGSNVNGVAGRWFSQLIEIESKPTLTVTSDPSGAAVTVDGSGYGRTPVTLRDLTPGAHTVVVSMPGRQTVTRSVELRAGGSHDVVATLEPEAPPVVVRKEPVKPPEPPRLIVPTQPITPPPPPLRAEHPGRTAKIVAGVLVGAAVVTAAVAIYTWRTYTDLETSAHNDLEAIKPMMVAPADAPFFMNPGCNVPADLQGAPRATQFHNECTSGNNYANATTGLWVATGALAAAGVVSFVIGDRQAAKAKERNVSVMRQTLRVAPVFSTRGGGLTAAFEF